MSAWSVPIRRPVATSMFFVAITALGLVAWNRIAVELFPAIEGDELYIQFARAGSEPAVVEREMLVPLESRIAELTGVEETHAEIHGSSGNLNIRFERGTDLQVRELDLRRLAAEIARDQPPGSFVEVSSQDLGALSKFVMLVQVTGMDDRHVLLDLVQERVEPRLAAISGVARVLTVGGATRELAVLVDPERCAAAGVGPGDVVTALARAVGRLDFVGGVEDGTLRTAVVLDGRPAGPVSLGDLRLGPRTAARLRHVADVDFGLGREAMLSRVNGKPAVTLVVFQTSGANLVRLGEQVRARLDDLRREFEPLGLDFVVRTDAADMVSEQLDRLEQLALSGFLISLAVLFIFLRQWRAVAVVAVAVPVSLLAALSLLYLCGQTLNLITLFGLAVGIGMLVDNSIVVYESVQRQLERGAPPDAAAERGVKRTIRAILAASVTNAVVFLPVVFVDFEQAVVGALLQVLALAIVLPLAGSLLVAVGLVPLLARRLAAPAALARLTDLRGRWERQAGLRAPDRGAELFSGLLTVALRRPAGWLSGVAAAVLATVFIAMPWIVVSSVSQEPDEADSVQFGVELQVASSLETALAVFDTLEAAGRDVQGVKDVESLIGEDGGSLVVHLLPPEERPKGMGAGRVREAVRDAAAELPMVELTVVASGERGGGGGGEGGGGLQAALGQTPATAVLSGPDVQELNLLAQEIEAQLEAIPEVAWANVQGRTAQPELRVYPDAQALEAFGLTADEVLPVLNVVRREGVELRTGFTLPSGREIPLAVRRESERSAGQQDLRRLRLTTPAGVLPLEAMAEVRRVPAPLTIVHRNGRREASVEYTLGARAPATGPSRTALEQEIRSAIQSVHRPVGYTVETPADDATFDWFRKLIVPILLLLYAVLAVTFESLTLPLLVLVALPLTVLGATWALALAGMPADLMAMVGAVALIGLTVNPAILLVDRMQQRAWIGGLSAGAAALASVRERTRPVLMTASTTVAGLWPLALATGREQEIWPPFATVVMGGLITSTILTLLVVPVAFVFLHRLDRLFGRLGPWVVLAWIGVTTLVVAPLIQSGLITTMTWQVVTTLLVASGALGAIVLFFRRPAPPEPEAADGPPSLTVRYLQKTYGRPGPVRRAWRVEERYTDKVLARGGRPFDPRRVRERIVPFALVLAGVLYLVGTLQTRFWRLVFLFAAAALFARLMREIRRARGKTDERGRVDPGGLENLAAALAPWAALAWAFVRLNLEPRWLGETVDVAAGWFAALCVIVALLQLGRRSAVKQATGQLAPRVIEGRLRHPRSAWRAVTRSLFGFDLPREQVRALSGVHFEVRHGMVGVLGPNGAGKTTLLRQLAGILEPSLGTISLGGVRIERLRRYLARYVGYLPQDFGLPDDLTAREYLEYYALLYEIGPAAARAERVTRLLEEVGLGERADEKIGGYSGGMRQRVAVARTLLRLPPIIIVDEPTVGLDPRERIRFRNLLGRLAEGRIVLFSTHVVEDVAVACERVLVLARGRLVFDGRPHDLAGRAEGRVWQASLTDEGARELPEGALIVDQVPDGTGRLRTRILSGVPPHPEAAPVTPTLEDGYFWLVGTEARI